MSSAPREDEGARGSLRRRQDFARVQAQGARVASPTLLVFVAPRPEESSPSRLGLVVGRAAGSAVVRNRIRRRLRAAWRDAAPSLGVDVVVRAQGRAAEVEFQELVGTFHEAMGGAGSAP